MLETVNRKFAAGNRSSPPWTSQALQWSTVVLVASSWISAASFGLYIAVFYLGAVFAGGLERWNGNLAGLYTPGATIASTGIAAHFVTGAIILVAGPVQLIAAVRSRLPRLHRWLGRIYVLAGIVAGAGGLVFIAVRGTIGGAVMNVGFGLYGALVVAAATETYRHARARRWEQHRAWAIRLFALAIGSWLYRMEYGFWLTATHRLGHTKDFHGWFDDVMAFFFYVPNLLLVELLLRARNSRPGLFLRASALAALNVATLFVVLGTYYFVRFYWGPAVIDAFQAHSR